jgi:hypothetical protein
MQGLRCAACPWPFDLHARPPIPLIDEQEPCALYVTWAEHSGSV